ncbi:MAG: thioredoxin [Candidatus Dadabacteria bacterium]|nr:thioredoxin [Candidatus Dadabacteria bacterium]
MGKTVLITDDNFDDEVVKSGVPVLLDFWAEWCPPCRAVAPVLDEIAGDYEGRIKVGKLNVDENPYTARAFGIRSIPTMILFKNGSPDDKIIGALPKGHITEVIENSLSKD